MAFTPFTLPKETTVYHTLTSGNKLELTLAAGTVVHREDTDTDSERVLTIRYTHDGFVWTRVQRKSKNATAQSAPAPVPSKPKPAAPVQPSKVVQEVVADTASAIHAGLDMLSARQVHREDAREQTVRRLEKTVKMFTGKIWRVNYYIPTSFNKLAPSPCVIFRKHCIFHDDGSNWLFTDEGLNHPDVQEVFNVWRNLKPTVKPARLTGFVKRVGVRFSTTELTPEQLATEKEAAQDQLSQALIEMHETLLERIENAATSLEKAQKELVEKGIVTQRANDKLDNTHNATLRQIVTSAVATFEMVLRGAEIFDDTGSLDAIIDASRNALAVTAMGVNLYLEAKKVKGVEVPASVVMNPSIGSGPAPR